MATGSKRMRVDHPFRRQRSGFSLVELMVVLVLIAILTAMILPEMRGTFEGELLRSTSRELVRGLSLAHSQSVTLNQRHRLIIDRSKNQYRVERYARSRDEGVGYVAVQGISGTQGELSSKIKIEVQPTGVDAADDASNSVEEQRTAKRESAGPNPTIEFQPDGTADAVEIQLWDTMGFGLGLRVSPITSRVQVNELTRKGST